MANENYLILQPTINTVVTSNKTLQTNLDALSGKYKLEIALKLSKNALKDIDAQIKSQIGSTNNLAVIEDRLNDSYKKQNIELQKRIELLEKVKKSSSSTQESPLNDNSVKKVNQQVEILQSRIERAKVSWSKMLGDPEIMSQVNSIQAALKDVGGDPKKYQDLNRQWQLLSNNIAVAELNTKSFGDRVTNNYIYVKSPVCRVICA